MLLFQRFSDFTKGTRRLNVIPFEEDLESDYLVLIDCYSHYSNEMIVMYTFHHFLDMEWLVQHEVRSDSDTEGRTEMEVDIGGWRLH